MSLPDTATAPGSGVAARALDDLRWHRQFHRQSQFRWWDTEAALVATEFTRGQDQFHTVQDLAQLEHYRLALADYTATCQRALGRALKQSLRVLDTRSWSFATDSLMLLPRTCEQSSYLATWADPYDPTALSNPQVRRIQRSCERMMFGNPLILSWELSHLWGLYRAAETLLEDTLVDLTVELSESVSDSALLWATQMASKIGLKERIAEQRTTRGEPGDPRRRPRQSYSDLR
ncbi:hypothetical protein CH275_09345 [Rhodococcus sp. 06-235-1A]|uniref:hypothetical protein n=1 Tax=Rhodococcus sp. 06-235-1A TaxID=2022508 RepID=UPI000B9C43B7|nr:hypothetical protein [Rhodococcus sp. 06-235-1A]OZD06420.1 hypothetical protein CH275_09345 [Rhodococcus sp. 06-235-1A]